MDNLYHAIGIVGIAFLVMYLIYLLVFGTKDDCICIDIDPIEEGTK